MISFLSGRPPFASPVGRRRFCQVHASTVVLTRQADSNVKARQAMLKHGVRPVELPLIEFKTRPEATSLAELLSKRKFQWVTLTSPQATRVFLEAWRAADRPSVRIATFAASVPDLEGEGTPLSVGCVPAVSNAEALVEELPKEDGVCEEILYPASSKAEDTLEKGLRSRHFVVTRLDTYETGRVDPREIDAAALDEALEADVLTFASPTAVRAWIDLTQEGCDFHKTVACIGSTTAKKARELGFENVYYAEKPGLEGLVQCVLGVLRQSGKLSTRA